MTVRSASSRVGAGGAPATGGPALPDSCADRPGRRTGRSGAGRRKVVLYNPDAVFHTMPLALLAVASALDRRRFRPVIVDARLEDDPHSRLVAELDGALALGVTVLTGAPIRDALAASRAAKAAFPDLPVVWGGWHPSLFPEATLDEPAVDVTVQAQGEVTFREVVERLAAGEGLDGVAGTARRGADGTPRRHPPRPMAPMESLPAHDYSLLDVEAYFAAKGRRQLDYVSSTGCLFRCAFCADPFVFGRRWTAIPAARIAGELAALHARHHLDEIAFQDETFFTYADRVGEIAEELDRHGLDVPWTATLRADQAVRLGEELFERCVASGMRRVMVGVESGSQEMLDWIEKDVTIEQVIATAELAARHGVDAIFPFIVGFPGESDESVAASLALVKRLRRMSPGFETPIFYFKPYPGSAITDRVVAAGFPLPGTLEEWAEFDFIGSSGPWVSPERRRLIERFQFYNRFAGGPETWLRRPLQWLSRWRCRHDFYAWPLERAVVERLAPSPRLS